MQRNPICDDFTDCDTFVTRAHPLEFTPILLLVTGLTPARAGGPPAADPGFRVQDLVRIRLDGRRLTRLRPCARGKG